MFTNPKLIEPFHIARMAQPWFCFPAAKAFSICSLVATLPALILFRIIGGVD
jgi:hypothetical protein